MPFYEAQIHANGHSISLVFTEPVVEAVARHAAFVVPPDGPYFKIPLP